MGQNQLTSIQNADLLVFRVGMFKWKHITMACTDDKTGEIWIREATSNGMRETLLSIAEYEYGNKPEIYRVKDLGPMTALIVYETMMQFQKDTGFWGWIRNALLKYGPRNIVKRFGRWRYCPHDAEAIATAFKVTAEIYFSEHLTCVTRIKDILNSKNVERIA